jgi:CxxC-x17-CxxC domain-containing protein
MAFADRTLTCVDCGTEFIFTARQQEFHQQQGFANEPKRCPDCRRQRKNARGDAPASYSSDRPRAPRQMFPATCANCGRETEVPFEPRTNRPVYCMDCYRTMAPPRR